MTWKSFGLSFVFAVLLAASPVAADRDFGEWSAPVNLGLVINSAFNDEVPAISRDGLSLYFASNRPGGSGGQDLWVALREDREADDDDVDGEDDGDVPWGAPVNLGPTVNTSANDSAPTFSRDGHRMFFASDRGGGSGGLDIWVSFREDEDDDFGWQAPVNLGPAINTTFNWTSTREDRREPWSTPVNLGPVVNSSSEEMQPAISRDARTLFFASNRPGGSGLLDLYMITRKKGD